ncbi:hypothetical protein GCM10020000_64250 [Streptomyces olivoverticillatus]
MQREAVPAGLGDPGDVENDDHGAFDEERGAQDLGVEVYLEPAERADGEHGGGGGHPPADVQAEVFAEEPGEFEAEQAVDPELHGAVGDQGDDGGGGSGGASEAAGDVGVEGAGVVDVLSSSRRIRS